MKSKIGVIMKVSDLIILGSGPAGWTAAVYAARAGLNPVVVTGYSKGGQLTTTTEVDNWPGAANGIDGTELVNQMEAHAVRFGTEVIMDEITSVDLSRNNPDKLLILKSYDKEYACKSLIICTGATAKYLGLPSEELFSGRGVSACATCDGFFYKGQEVAVVGGGNTAVEEAIYLSKIASKVHLIHRRDTLKAEQIMVKHLMSLVDEGKIVLHLDSVTEEIVGDKQGVTGIKITNKHTNETSVVNLQGVFIAIGHSPKTEMFKGQLLMDNGGFLITQKATASVTQTNIDGVFAAGDVQDPIYRQAVTSAGAGCQAALDAAKYLESLN